MPTFIKNPMTDSPVNRAIKLLIIALIIVLSSCQSEKNISDAYGNFEATEVIVSSETNGRILDFTVEEGMNLKAGQVVGRIDSVQSKLKVDQIHAQKATASERIATAQAQISTVEAQLKGAETDLARINKLFTDGAATCQQYDDIHNRYEVLKTQLATARAQLKSAQTETGTLDVQNRQALDLLTKCTIVNPINGTVLERYAETGELAAAGSSLYKIADLSALDLKVYITGVQLSQFKTGDKVTVIIDADKHNTTETTGTVTWISSQSEFTPKIIQTKEERVNLVYAMKVRVANPNGMFKIGMPGEIRK
jgi:HlyD family secretion protein